MYQMKGRRDLQLHFTWGEPWVQGRVLVDPGLLHRLEPAQMICSQALAANNISLVGLKNNLASKISYFLINFQMVFSVLA